MSGRGVREYEKLEIRHGGPGLSQCLDAAGAGACVPVVSIIKDPDRVMGDRPEFSARAEVGGRQGVCFQWPDWCERGPEVATAGASATVSHQAYRQYARSTGQRFPERVFRPIHVWTVSGLRPCRAFSEAKGATQREGMVTIGIFSLAPVSAMVNNCISCANARLEARSPSSIQNQVSR